MQKHAHADHAHIHHIHSVRDECSHHAFSFLKDERFMALIISFSNCIVNKKLCEKEKTIKKFIKTLFDKKRHFLCNFYHR